ncbi:hypothetical protein GCM10010267_61970 [Streptomyces griseorubens]|nr:hypothetical protein GCM10010267_61970 [Streptomyces griseorubens]
MRAGRAGTVSITPGVHAAGRTGAGGCAPAAPSLPVPGGYAPRPPLSALAGLVLKRRTGWSRRTRVLKNGTGT